jgi:hypothetical protein
MVNSTKIIIEISDRQKVRQYYSIFINTIAILAKSYGARIVKSAGDALIEDYLSLIVGYRDRL